MLARALDTEWERLGRPRPFTVVEAGAGRGALARAVLDAAPGCGSALRYVCVERVAALRERAAATVGGRGGSEGMVLVHLPHVPGPGVVVANELLDNLPFRLLERREGSWGEVRVGLSAGGDLAEVLVTAAPELAAAAEVLAPRATPGARVPLQGAAADYLGRALGCVDAGRVIVVDHCDTTSALAARPWRQWVRTYRGHRPGGDPLAAPGRQDLVCEVATDQLAAVRRPDADRTQAEWLACHGIEELVAQARATWQERAGDGGLDALVARSRVGEAAALCDPAGLGAARVLEWTVGPPGPAPPVPGAVTAR